VAEKRKFMEICILASGSKGNCIYIAGGGTALLIDAGLSAKETLRRMETAGLDKDTVKSILLTHDHSDHCKGTRVLSEKLEAELYANEGTATSLERMDPRLQRGFTIFDGGGAFEINDLRIEPFQVPHDASDTVGFVIDDGSSRICIVTDIGQPTALVKVKMLNCDMIVVESNHDYDMLMESERSWSLKQRIAGRSGHLSNDDAAGLITETISSRLKNIVLAHLSEDCNTPHLARSTMIGALHGINRDHIPVRVASQTMISEIIKF
jgi:phosphoribosyl 1,2-cyclic phosphodiesterase